MPQFDIVILDDASLCPELSTIVPLTLRPTAFIMFGDKHSEPVEMAIDKECHKKRLDRSLFKRILENLTQFTHDFRDCFELCETFRMPPGICKLLNELFYENSIKVSESIRNISNVFCPFLVIDASSISKEQNNQMEKIARQMYNKTKKKAINAGLHFAIVFPTQEEVEEFNSIGGNDEFDKKHRHCLVAENCLNRETDVLFLWITNNLNENHILNHGKYLQKIFSRAKKSIFICGDISALPVSFYIFFFLCQLLALILLFSKRITTTGSVSFIWLSKIMLTNY